MENSNWVKNFYQSLEAKKDNFLPADFRFYNIARLPILADKTYEFSSSCPDCKSNITLLNELLDNLPECLHQYHTRKKFEKTRNQIELHLHKTHNLRYASYYTSLYTLLGTIIGCISGMIFIFLAQKKFEMNIVLIFIAIGLISGYILGKRKDKLKYKKKLQI
ncbi:hypothetical protein ES705_03316 [subsurface metagenome]